MMGILSKYGIKLIQYGCVAHCFVKYVGTITYCSGVSMEPTINSGNVVLAEHLTISSRKLKRGQVVMSRNPLDPHMYICKRVVGLEGDHVPLRNNKQKMYKVGKGHVWLEGDNKENSIDSNTFLGVPYCLLEYRVVFRVWPPHKAGYLPLPREETKRLENHTSMDNALPWP